MQIRLEAVVHLKCRQLPFVVHAKLRQLIYTQAQMNHIVPHLLPERYSQIAICQRRSPPLSCLMECSLTVCLPRCYPCTNHTRTPVLVFDQLTRCKLGGEIQSRRASAGRLDSLDALYNLLSAQQCFHARHCRKCNIACVKQHALVCMSLHLVKVLEDLLAFCY